MDKETVAEQLDVSRREFMVTGVAALSMGNLEGGTFQVDASEGNDYLALATLEGPRSARPTVDELTEDRIVYAYRYIDTVTKGSWYVDDDLSQWHPEPIGAADVATDNGEAHTVSIVSRDGRLFARRYE